MNKTTAEGGETVGESVTEGEVAPLGLMADGIFFGKVFDLYYFHRDVPVELWNCGIVELDFGEDVELWNCGTVELDEDNTFIFEL